MLKVLLVFGTRPEAIKMAPVIREMRERSNEIESVVLVTGQHREMLDQVLDLFGISAEIDLDLMEDDQPLSSFAAKALPALSRTIEQVRPDMVLVQGDTTTAMVGALTSFYHRVPVGHIEAGLRTRNPYRPFPEEMNRRLVSVLATVHFAPTETAAQALRDEGTPEESIFVTGNPVIDALLWMVSRHPSAETTELLIRFGLTRPSDFREDWRPGAEHNVSAWPVDGHKVILVTAHRRENFGKPLENICCALRAIAERNSDVSIIYPVHMNPHVREPVFRILGERERVHLLEPLGYEAFSFLLQRVYLVLTDSGGIQEEAPSLGKPVLVMRTETERPEAVRAGTARIVGVETAAIVEETERFLKDHEAYELVARAVNPYGDGHAAKRIAETLLHFRAKSRPVAMGSRYRNIAGV